MGSARMTNGAVKGDCCEAAAGREIEGSITTNSPHLYEFIHRCPQKLGVCSHKHVDKS